MLINCKSAVIEDLTTLFTEISSGVVFGSPSPKYPISITTKLLLGGTTVTGRLEGSNDETTWDTLQASDTTISVANTSKNVVISTLPFKYLRYNVTGITGTALVLMYFYNN